MRVVFHLQRERESHSLIPSKAHTLECQDRGLSHRVEDLECTRPHSIKKLQHLKVRFKISVNMNILVFGFYEYMRNISGYFDKNIDEAKIIQNSWECLKKLQKNDKISKNILLKLFCKCNQYKYN